MLKASSTAVADGGSLSVVAVIGFLAKVKFAGWDLTQWALLAAVLIGAYLVAWLLTWPVTALIRRRAADNSQRVGQLVAGPVRVLVWVVVARQAVPQLLVLSEELRPVFAAGTLFWIALAWASIRMVVLAYRWWTDALERQDRYGAAKLLRPLRTLTLITVVLFALLSWLANLGVNIGTVLAGLGVGGLAVALAAQDSLRNFIGSLMILIDRPYRLGDRIITGGHDGLVEEIGLRSTKIRLFTGHLTTIPNAKMAASDIENVTRRPSIRRKGQLYLALDTPPEKLERAVSFVREALAGPEGMEPGRPAQIYFDEIDRDALRVSFTYWYQPPDFLAAQEFAEKLNLRIVTEFASEGIALAAPSSRTQVIVDSQTPVDKLPSKLDD